MLQRLVDIKTDATAAFEKESKTLLVRLDNNLITLALADKVTSTWQAAEILKVEKPERTDEAFINNLKQASSLINYKGLPTQVLIATQKVMAVPAALADSISLFFQTQFGSCTPIILTNSVDNDIVFAFAPQTWQQELVATLFPEALLKNTLALLTRQSLLQAKNGGTCFYVHVGKDYAEAVLMKQGQLAIARNLSYTTVDDLLYYLLNIARQFDVSPASLSVQLQGWINEEDALYHLLQTYFAPVSFASSVAPIQHKAFWQTPPHYFTGLMEAL